MATNVRFVDQIKIISTEAGGGDSSISSSYALSASHADFATSASYAEYAVSASHEITKEVSSSYADTASLALSGNGPFTGSFTGSFFGNGSGVFSGSFSGSIPDAYQIISGSVSASISPDNGLRINSPVDITMPSGSVFTIHEPDIDQQNRLDFKFDQGNPILEIASRTTTSSFHLKQDQTGAGLLLDSLGKIKYITGGTTYGVAFTTTGFNPNVGNQINLGYYNRRWKNIYINSGDKISFGVSDSTNIDLVSLRHTVGTNTLVMSGSSDVTLDVKGDLNVSTNITASNNISASNNIFTKQLYVENNLAIDYDFSHNCISFGNVSDCLNLLGTSITASSNLSSSATSTASFGTYLGDGSQLTGIETDPFPYTGDAQITGSLIISGSFITSRNSDLSNTIIGSSSAAAMNSGATGNVIIGNETAKSLTFGDDNVIIGENAGQSITSGYDNVYIGHNSGLQSHPTNAIGNVVIGVDAGLGSGGGTAYRNVFVGQMAGYNVDGAANVYVGWQAGRGEAGADGTANSGFGAFALTDNRDGNYNIGIGYYAGGAIKDGSNNIFIGSGSLGELSTEAQLRIGHADLITISASLATGDIIFPSTASAAYFVGDGSQLTNLPSSDPFPYTGDATITGSLIVSGSFLPIGKTPLSAGNVIIGEGAGAIANAQTTYNVFIGRNAGGNDNDYGDQNVLIGNEAGYLGNQTGNTSIGYHAGRGWGTTGTSPTIGYNTSIGYQSGYGAATRTTAIHNTFLGAFTGRNVNPYGGGNGNGNVLIGYYAGYENVGDGNIIIGSGSIGEDYMANQLRIGHGDNHIISGSLETGHILLQTTTISGSLLNSGTVSLDNTASPYTLTGTQQFILIDPSGGDVTVNMPDAATYPGREIRFKLTQAAGANTVTLQRQGADTIDGATTYTDLDIQYESISTVSNGGTGWFIF